MLRADDLAGRLRLLIPGETAPAVAERRYVEKQLDNVFRQLNYHERVNRRSPRQQVAAITARYHTEVFRTYRREATLADAFRSGSYSDATAALLLALTLERYGLAYEGHVDHWEVYLVAQPDDRTSVTLRWPSRPRTAARERSYRREYLALLRAALPDTPTELEPAAADSLFTYYHYPTTQRLSFRQLAAYAKFQRALQFYAADQFATCRALLGEARQQDDRHAFYLWQRAAALQQERLRQVHWEARIGKLFTQWQQDTANRYYPAALLRAFDVRQQELLAARTPTEALALLKNFSTRGPARMDDWRKQLQLLQSLRLLAYYQERGEEVQALHLAQALLAAHPGEARYADYVAELTLVQLRHTYADPRELVRRADAAAERYPFIRRHDRYADIVLREVALEVRDRFAELDEAAGLRALRQFEERLRAVPGGHDRSLWTLTAYVAASNYYFAERNYPQARKYLAEALRHDPTNDFLLHQQDLLRRY